MLCPCPWLAWESLPQPLSFQPPIKAIQASWDVGNSFLVCYTTDSCCILQARLGWSV